MLELNTTSPYQELHAFLSIDSVLFDLLGQISPTKRREQLGVIVPDQGPEQQRQRQRPLEASELETRALP